MIVTTIFSLTVHPGEQAFQKASTAVERRLIKFKELIIKSLKYRFTDEIVSYSLEVLKVLIV